MIFDDVKLIRLIRLVLMTLRPCRHNNTHKQIRFAQFQAFHNIRFTPVMSS